MERTRVLTDLRCPPGSEQIIEGAGGEYAQQAKAVGRGIGRWRDFEEDEQIMSDSANFGKDKYLGLPTVRRIASGLQKEPIKYRRESKGVTDVILPVDR